MKQCFKYTLWFVFIYQLVVLSPVFIFSGKIIGFLDVGEHEDDQSINRYYNLASEVSNALWFLYPCAMIQSTNEVIKTFSFSQGVEASFGWFYLFSSVITSPICWYCIVTKGQGLNGYAAYKYTNEILNLLFCLYIYFFRLNP